MYVVKCSYRWLIFGKSDISAKHLKRKTDPVYMFTNFYIHDAINKTITNAIGKDHWQMHTFKHHTYSTYIPTPLWKSNRNFFSTQIVCHSFFVVCSSFYTWYMWGDQYQLCKFLLDFDHWLYLSDILKIVTGWKTRCRVSLIYAVDKDRVRTWGKRPVLV